MTSASRCCRAVCEFYASIKRHFYGDPLFYVFLTDEEEEMVLRRGGA